MARPKKRRADDPPSDPFPSKKAKSSPQTTRRARVNSTLLDHAPSNEETSSSRYGNRLVDHIPRNQLLREKPTSSDAVHGPDFYNNLSKVSLTPRALQEHNRRNTNPLEDRKPVGTRRAKVAALGRLLQTKLEKLAAAGGPDLRDISGYPGPSNITQAMASLPGSSSNSRRTRSTKATSVSSKSGRSSAYDANFEQHCIDHNIYPPVYKFADRTRPSKPANFQEIRQALKVPRGSLSPSVVPDTAFDDFQDKNATKSEGTVMRNVVPLVAGDADILNEGHVPFANLASITGNTTVLPVPDFFDGAHPAAVDKKVKEDLYKIIVPSRKAGIPIAPNFFLEAKGSGGTIEVAVQQAVLDGAYGARMMHALQNYGVDPPVFDGNAYAFSSTLLNGYLNLYSHHLSPPASSAERPGYITTLLKAYALSDDEVYSEGRGAFRNLRARARDDRDRLIKIANSRAYPGMGDSAELARTAPEGPCSSPLVFFEYLPFPELGDGYKTHEIHDTQETNVGLAIINQAYGKDDAAGSPDIGTSPASSFTSSSHEAPLHSQPKLPRTPPSPSSTRPGKRSAKCQPAAAGAAS